MFSENPSSGQPAPKRVPVNLELRRLRNENAVLRERVWQTESDLADARAAMLGALGVLDRKRWNNAVFLSYEFESDQIMDLYAQLDIPTSGPRKKIFF